MARCWPRSPIDEGAKHRPLQIKLQAVRSGNGFKLSGAKAFVVDGHTADLLIVAARTGGSPGERNGLTLFLVDPKAKGHRGRAHRDGRCAQCRAHRIR